MTLGGQRSQWVTSADFSVYYSIDSFQWGLFGEMRIFDEVDLFVGLGTRLALSGGPASGFGAGLGLAFGFLNDLPPATNNGVAGLARIVIDYRFGAPGITLGLFCEWISFVIPVAGTPARAPFLISFGVGYLL